MASEIKIISQARNGQGTPKIWDYKPGGKHPAEANQIYKIVVDGKEELPVGTKIARKGNAIVFDFPDGTIFTIDDWCSVSDSRITELVNGQAYSSGDSAYVSAKDIDSGTCVIWGEAGQSGAVLGDSGLAPATNTVAAPASGDDHTAAAIIAGVLGLGALAALSHDSGGGDSNSKSPPRAGVPDAVDEDFSPIAITASTIKASDDGGQSKIQIVSAAIKSASGFDFSDDANSSNDDIRIVTGSNGALSLELNPSGANKFGTITTTIRMRDADGNETTEDVVFTVNAVNDNPINQINGAAIVNGQHTLPPHGFGFPTVSESDGLLLSVADADESTGLAEHLIDHVTISTDDGHFTVTQPSGSSVVIDGDNMGSVTLTGTQEEINLTLESLVWHDDTGSPGDERDVTLTMTSTDKSGAQDIDTIIIPVTGAGTGSVGGNGGVLSGADLFSVSTQVANAGSGLPARSLDNLIGNINDQVPPSA